MTRGETPSAVNAKRSYSPNTTGSSSSLPRSTATPSNVEPRQRRLALAERLFGQKEDRALILLGQVEGLGAEVERVLDRPRREHDPRDLAVSAEKIMWLRLLCSVFVGIPVDGPARAHSTTTTGISSDAGKTDRLGHQRLARSRSRRHRAHAGEGRTDHHVDRGQLVFGLHRDAAELGQILRHPLQHVGRRRDRVAGHEAAARDERAVGDRVVAHHDQTVAVVAFA